MAGIPEGPYKDRLLQYQNLYLVLIAVIIGIAASFGNILFRTAIAWIQNFCYGEHGEVVLPVLQQAPFYKILLIPALGGLLVGLIYHFYKTPRGRGVPMVIKAIVMKKRIPPMMALITTLTSAITLGTGGSAGREGPIVQIGAAIGSGVGRLFGFSKNRLRFAIASGAGGGLAATFNTPMAGAMFTAEVLLGRLEFKVFAPVVISCVSATVVSRAWFGNHVTFTAPEYVFTSVYELPLYALLGLLAGICGAVFIKFYFYTADLFGRMTIPVWLKPALGGLMLGVIGLFCRNIMGVGYGTIMQILDESLIGYFLLLLVGLKIVATSLTLGSGGSGGLFVPSLFVGAALGGFVGWGISGFAPEYFSSSGSYALVGMGAVLAATMRAPITAILMIFEITQSYQIVLPLMCATIIAHVFASWLEKDSFFTRPLVKEGFNIHQGTEAALLEQVCVKDVMVKDIVVFYEDTSFADIVQQIRQKPHEFFPVVTKDRILVSVISLKDIKQVLFEQGLDNIIVAGDLCDSSKIRTVTPDSTLAEAFKILGEQDSGDIPVTVEVPEGPKLVGLLRRNDVLVAYNKKVLDMVRTTE